MAPSQLEDAINAALKNDNVKGLEEFLQKHGLDETPIKCTQQFLVKLDKLVNKSLDQNDPKGASLVYMALYKYGKHVKLPGGGLGFSGLLTQGLIKKLMNWFEKSRQLLVQCGPQWDKALFTLCEDLLNTLMMVHEASKEGTFKITEAFLYPLGQLVVDPRVYILIQKEAIRKFNYFLGKIPAELKEGKKLLTSQEASDIMMKLAAKILDGGDYDCQSSLMEALCRIATAEQRKELAYRWFSMGHVASAFAMIRDSEFETASRKFLNMVNGMQGERRRVYSYPCLEVYLDSYELLMPADEKLEEFWIDFNLGSCSISFYFTLADEDAQEAHWETICVSESDVLTYTVTEQGKRKILQVKMSEVVVVGCVEGSTLTIHFSSSLDILQAALKVYGQSKNKISSVSKASQEDSSTQVVPESQVSLSGSERNTAPCPFFAQSLHSQKTTPAKMRISESISFISGSAGRTMVRGRPLNNALNGKGTLSMEKVHSSGESSRNSCYSSTLGSRDGLGFKVQCDVPSTASKQATKKRHTDQFKKTRSLVEAVPTVLTGEGDHKSQEQDIVRDTQPSAGSNTSLSVPKMSISEMLMMPTQKMGSLPGPEPVSNLAGTQERRRSGAQKWSVSDSTSVSGNQLHIDLTHRLQKILDEQNGHTMPEQPAVSQRMQSKTTEGPKEKGPGKELVSSLSIPKVQQVQGDTHVKPKGKGHNPLALRKSVDPPSVKEKTSTSEEAQSRKVASSRAQRDSEATGSMVKLISSRYEVKAKSTTKSKADPGSLNHPLVNSRSTINMMWSSTFKKEVSGSFSENKAKAKSSRQKKDIFAFSMDSPLLIGGGNISLNDTSILMKSNSKVFSSCVVSTNKTQPEQSKGKRYVKNHLFSDTDTDNAKTDYSWLRESSRKPKPKVTKYSRPAPTKPARVPSYASGDSSDLFPPPVIAARSESKANKKNAHVKKEANPLKKTVKAGETTPRKAHAVRKRPRRAAAISTKNYKEPNTDDSHSETEESPPPEGEHFSHKLKKHLKADNECEVPQRTKTKDGNPKLSKCNSKRSEDVRGLSKLHKKKILPVQRKRSTPLNSCVVQQASPWPSPSEFIEKMRSDKRSVPTLDLTSSPLRSLQGTPLPASPNPSDKDIPSPIPLRHKSLPTVSSKEKGKASSFYSADKKHSSSKAQSIPSFPSPRGQTPTHSLSIGINAAEENLLSAPQSPFSLPTQPLLTSTVIEQVKPNVPSPSQPSYPKDSVDYGQSFAFPKLSPVFQASLSQSSSKSSVVTGRMREKPDTARSVSPKIEKTPRSYEDLEVPKHPHVSGPCRKRHCSSLSSSEDEGKEREKRSKMRGQHSPRMKPRKLFKSFTEVPAVNELDQVTMSSRMSSTSWQAEEVYGDVELEDFAELTETGGKPNKLCQQFSSELKKKFQIRCGMMESYKDQTLKTVQQYVSSINAQVTKYRRQRLEQVQKVLLEEIHKLEQDDTVLKGMEKDLTAHWKRQSSLFHSYQKQETIRYETLRRSLDSNVCYNSEYEEQLFKSQMDMMRKDMKSIQNRLLSEMQEKELQSVKRGLRVLFFP